VRGIGVDVYIVGEQGLALKLDRAAGRFRALELPYKGTLFGLTGTTASSSCTACAAACCAARTAGAAGSR
jgi:UDP-N-acetylmuramyl tripeptide synthase